MLHYSLIIGIYLPVLLLPRSHRHGSNFLNSIYCQMSAGPNSFQQIAYLLVIKYGQYSHAVSLWSCRFLQEESSVVTEVWKDRESHAGLHRLSSAPSGTNLPIAGKLRRQVQEGQEKLQLQVRSIFFLPWNPESRSHRGNVSLISPLLPRSRSIYIFLLFIIWSSLSYFPYVSTELSTFNGTTRNATCFPSTASPTVRRGRPTPTSLCMKKKVHVVIFTVLTSTLPTPLNVQMRRGSCRFLHRLPAL